MLIFMIRNYRNLLKIILKVIVVIEIEWESTFRAFEELRLHTLKIIQKCALTNYTLSNFLQLLKFSILYRLQHSKQNIFRAILSIAADWSWVIDELFTMKIIQEDELKNYNIQNDESFLLKIRKRVHIFRYFCWENKTHNFANEIEIAKKCNVFINVQFNFTKVNRFYVD